MARPGATRIAFTKERTKRPRLGDLARPRELDTYRDAIAQRVVESYPPRYRPSEQGRPLPHLLRAPLGAQADAIRGAALSLEAQRGTTVVGEMGTGKTFIAASAAHMAGFQRVLVLCPPHLTRKWKREVEETVPGARAVIVASITDLERLRTATGAVILDARCYRVDVSHAVAEAHFVAARGCANRTGTAVALRRCAVVRCLRLPGDIRRREPGEPAAAGSSGHTPHPVVAS